MEIKLDEEFIFKGEIERAWGDMADGTEAFGDVSCIHKKWYHHCSVWICNFKGRTKLMGKAYYTYNNEVVWF